MQKINLLLNARVCCFQEDYGNENHLHKVRWIAEETSLRNIMQAIY